MKNRLSLRRFVTVGVHKVQRPTNSKRPLFYVLLLVLVGAIAWPMVVLAGEILHYGPSGFTWPTTWKAIPGLNDPDDNKDEHLDFVGNDTYPGTYYAGDASYLYFRIRVDVGTVGSGTFGDTVMILINRGQDCAPDYAFAWDSKEANHGLEMMMTPTVQSAWTWAKLTMEDADGNNGQKIVPPDFNTTGQGYIRTIDGQSAPPFGTTTFIDFAISWNYLNTLSNTMGLGTMGLGKGQSWGIQLGSIAKANDHSFIGEDIAGGLSPASSLTGTLSSCNCVTIGFTANAIALTQLTATSASPLSAVGVAVVPIALLASGIVVGSVLVWWRRRRC